MYNSLRQWCRFPVNVSAFIRIDPSGDAVYDLPDEHCCYRADKIVAITDKFGVRYESNTQLYFPAELAISEEDVISFGDGPAQTIHRINGFYDGNTGEQDIKVVYL